MYKGKRDRKCTDQHSGISCGRYAFFVQDSWPFLVYRFRNSYCRLVHNRGSNSLSSTGMLSAFTFQVHWKGSDGSPLILFTFQYISECWACKQIYAFNFPPAWETTFWVNSMTAWKQRRSEVQKPHNLTSRDEECPITLVRASSLATISRSGYFKAVKGAIEQKNSQRKDHITPYLLRSERKSQSRFKPSTHS